VAETGQLTLWERPTRIAMAGFTVGGAGVLTSVGTAVLTVGAAVGVLLGVVGTVQLAVGLRRSLGGPDSATPPSSADPSGTLSGGAAASGS
jgi:CDP-diacylglycerol--glycerol-3-phosphate 3-phosphatidyltransferase